jgi:hypothetical protein
MRSLSQLILLLLLSISSVQAELLDFKPDSLPSIVEQHAGDRFLLFVWSVDCPACKNDLANFSKLQQIIPNNRIILLNSDGELSSQKVAQTIAEFGLEGLENWKFADSATARLRYKLDQNWAGELPRSYFYAADSSRQAFSGSLDVDQLKEWLLQ